MDERLRKQRRAPSSNERARELRRDQTKAERRLWRAIRDRQIEGMKFRRQMPVGPYIVDFACPTGRLIVELDGGQHAEQRARDEARSRFLASQGYRVLRFWNNEVIENLEGVLAAICDESPR
jgi:very-short-patch-repair endonuclease